MPDDLAGNSTLWVRAYVEGDNVIVKCLKNDVGTPSEATWDCSTLIVYNSNQFTLDGGFLGFGTGGEVYIDQLTVEGWDGNSWETEGFDDFEIVNTSYAGERLPHDAAGNLTYDGNYRFTYDAWNRLVKVERAFRDADGDLTPGSVVATIQYDPLGRRTVKEVTNSADWNATYCCYYGQRTVYHGTDEDWMMWKAQPMYPRLESTRVKPPRRESKTRRSLGEGGRRGFLFGKKRNPPKPLAGEGG